MRRPWAPLLPVVASLLVFLAPSAPAFAQSTSQASQPAASGTAQAVARIYDAAREVTVQGAVTETISRPAPGLPLGLHLMLATPQGSVDVHLGPYFARIAADRGLIPGAAVQVTGVTAHFAAGDVFLARRIVVGGQTITVRNANGIPVRQTALPARTVRGMQPTGGE